MKESEGQWQEKRAAVKCIRVEAADQAAGLNALGLIPFVHLAVLDGNKDIVSKAESGTTHNCSPLHFVSTLP